VLCLLSAVPAWSDQANVFVYHRFNDSRFPSTNISAADFQAQLELLQREQFVVLKLGEVVDRLRSGVSLPSRCAVITVDDAYRSFLTNGWPLLKRYGFPATLFVSTDTVGGSDYLSWQELATLRREGVEIGNHSASHAHLLNRLHGEGDLEWAARVSADIKRAQQALLTHLGSAPQLFAYPYGEFDPALAGLAKRAGFTAAFGQQSGVVTADQDIFSLPRFPVAGAYASLAEFRSKLFMMHLETQVIMPKTPVISGQNPPVLTIYVNQEGLDRNSLRCFVAGSRACTISKLNDSDRAYEVKALQPITGRRSKYTLTASGAGGKVWYWFSQLWIRPDVGEMADHSVPR
jgi:peptidoglycan/xylan/chitin deacetylase (PgdA/CDA1 family)